MRAENVRHQLTRRRFMQLAAGGVTATLMSGLLIACGGDDDDDDPDPIATTAGTAPTPTTASATAPSGAATATTGTEAATATTAGAPATATVAAPAVTATTAEAEAELPFADLIEGLPLGGNVNLGYAIGQPAHLDTQLTSATLSRLTSDPFNDWLVRFDVDSEIVPSLATAVEVVDDLTVQFTMRQGVMFHNGRALARRGCRAEHRAGQEPGERFAIR